MEKVEPSVQVSTLIGPMLGTILLFFTMPALGEWAPFLYFASAIFLNPAFLLSANGLLFSLWMLLWFSMLFALTLIPFFIYATETVLILAPLPRNLSNLVGFFLSRAVIVSGIILFPILLASSSGIPLFP